MLSQNFRKEFFNSLYDFSKSRKEFLAKAMLSERQTIGFSMSEYVLFGADGADGADKS